MFLWYHTYMNAQLKEKLLSLPTSSGVYLMKDKFGNVIYVGKAKNLKRRVNSYFIGNDKPIKTYNLTIKELRKSEIIKCKKRAQQTLRKIEE